MEATFKVTVKPEGHEARTYTVEAPERNDGYEGPAQTRAMMEWLRENEAAGNKGLRGEFVEYEVEKVA